MTATQRAVMSCLFVVRCSAPMLAAETTDDAFFPIMAWNHAPGDAAALAKMHERGLTVAGFVTPDNLDRVDAAVMKAIVTDPRVGNYDWRNVDAAAAKKNVQRLVAAVGKDPAVFGYY